MPKATTHNFKLREKNIDGAKAFLIRKEDKHENPACSGGREQQKHCKVA